MISSAIRLARTVAAIVCVLGAVVAGTGQLADDRAQPAAAAAQQMTPIRVLLPFLNGTSFFPVGLADQLGYFQDEGISVDVQNPGESSDVVKGVVAGNGDVGLSLAPPIILGASQGFPMKVVANWLYVRVHDVHVLADSPYNMLADLKGKAIATSDPNSGGMPLLQAELQDAGLDPDKDVSYVFSTDDFGPKLAAIQAGKAVAMNIEPNNQSAAQAMGIQLRCLTCDNKVRNSSEAWLVRPDYFAQNRKLLGGYFRALIKAAVFAQANPDAAYALMKNVRPAEFANPDAVRILLNTELQSFGTFADGQHGVLDTDGWNATQDFLLRAGQSDPTGLQSGVDMNDLLDNSLAQEMNNFDEAAVVNQAQTYSP
jgi:NitT/TauT family transport system substrate-binding protein